MPFSKFYVRTDEINEKYYRLFKQHIKVLCKYFYLSIAVKDRS